MPSNPTPKPKPQSERNPAGDGPVDGKVAAELKAEHQQVRDLLEQAGTEFDTPDLAKRIAEIWLPHAIIEEEIIVPALREKADGEVVMDQAAVHRDLVRIVLGELLADDGTAPAKGKLKALAGELKALINLEEQPDGGLFARAQKQSVDLDQLAPQIERRRAQLITDAEGHLRDALEPRTLRYLGSATRRQEEEYSTMPNNQTRDRDEYGRFRSDDDRGGYRDRDERGRFASDDREYSARSRRADDYDDRRDRNRDENGRFTSDDRGYSSRSRRDYDEDDEGRGWHGDPEGHSQAARRGWASREGAGYSSSGRGSSDRDYDDRGRSEGRGWYGDREGHSEAAQRGWERRDDERGYSSRDRDDDRRYAGRYRDDDRSEGRGWYGDPEGHSEAAHRGWERREGYSSRSSRDDDDDRGNYRSRDEQGRFTSEDRGYSSRSRRDDDDDDRYSRRNPGWSGDPRGHSEAARRGWENRRH